MADIHMPTPLSNQGAKKISKTCHEMQGFRDDTHVEEAASITGHFKGDWNPFVRFISA